MPQPKPILEETKSIPFTGLDAGKSCVQSRPASTVRNTAVELTAQPLADGIT